jgi:prepilin-type processing-associated H-X9-DG protein
MRGCRTIDRVVMTPERDFLDATTRGAHRVSGGYRFGASHPSGVNAVFADGGVRVISYGVAPEVFQRACVRNDGQTFNLNDL